MEMGVNGDPTRWTSTQSLKNESSGTFADIMKVRVLKSRPPEMSRGCPCKKKVGKPWRDDSVDQSLTVQARGGPKFRTQAPM